MQTTKMLVLAMACAAIRFSDIAAQEPAGREAGAEDTVKIAQVALRRGLDWLKSAQRPDGSWSDTNFPALTALGLWAFARSDHPARQEVCSKAAEFVALYAQPDGGIYKPATAGRGSGGLSVYNTAVCMTALHAWDPAKYRALILKAREFMAGSQLVGDSPGAGGFGYEPPRPRADEARRLMERGDLSNTAWAMRAMRETQNAEDYREGAGKVDIDWAATIRFIEKLQNRDADDPENFGSFGYEPGGERGGTAQGKDGKVTLRGYGSMTYAALEAMIFAQLTREDPRVRSALEWASRHWSVDENPGMGLKGLFYYYNTMSKALTVAGADALTPPDGRTVPWKEQLVRKIAALQKPDGSWVNEDNQFWEGNPALVTSYAALALEYILGR